MNTIPAFRDLIAKDSPTAEEKMIFSAVELLCATTEFRPVSLEQIYTRIAAGADVRIDFANGSAQN